MRALIAGLWLAGVVQLVIIIANFVLPKKLGCRAHLSRVSPMIREVFVIHWIYIVFVLGIFASLCFWFAPELAGASRLGRFLSTVMAVFWLVRVENISTWISPFNERVSEARDAGHEHACVNDDAPLAAFSFRRQP